MYKRKLSPIMRFNLTPEVITAIRSNSTFLENDFFLVAKSRKHRIGKQIIPLIRNFHHSLR